MVFGNTTKYEGAIGTSIAKVFDMTVASTGLAAKRLRQFGIPYASSTTHSASHAGYYPDALPLTLKLTFDPASGKLYGGQCVGYDGADKRIDQIALLIKQGGTVYDLIKVEHAYAPPFSSAKDPIAIAGYVAGNIISGAMPVATWRQMAEADRCDTLFLDVRTREEHAFGAIPGSVNIPLDELRSRIGELPRDKNIYIYCAVGLRGYLAMKILTGRGFKNVKNLSGGYKTYATATAPIENKTATIRTKGKTDTRHTRGAGQNLENRRLWIAVPRSGHEDQTGDRLDRRRRTNRNGRHRRRILARRAGMVQHDGNILISNSEEKGKYTVVIEKGSPQACRTATSCDGKAKTLIMFSDDLDKALATFVLANGAAATGQKVSIFFTFWGLNVIKKVAKPKVKKDIFGRMFGMMLPSSSLRLHLSKMSMFESATG